jgi:hypothetical protein
MQVPVLNPKKVQLVITEARLREELGFYSDRRAEALAKVYLSIGGRKDLRWDDSKPIAVISKRIESEAERLVNRQLGAGRKRKSVTVSHETFITKSDGGPRLLVAVEFPYYYALCTAWFDHLRKKGREVYGLFRMILAKIVREFPNYSAAEYFENVVEMYEPESLDEEFTVSLKADCEEIINLRDGYGNRKLSIAAIERMFRRVEKILSRNHRKWVRLAIRAMEESDRAFTRETPWLHNGVPEEFMERPTPERFFLICSRPHDTAEQVMTEDINAMAGEYGPPLMFFNIRSRKDLRSAARVLLFYRLLQELFYSAETVFGSVYYRDEKRKAREVKEQNGNEPSQGTAGV